MKIFSASQIKELDDHTIKNEPIDSIDLMERASLAFVNWLVEKFDKKFNIRNHLARHNLAKRENPSAETDRRLSHSFPSDTQFLHLSISLFH